MRFTLLLFLTPFLFLSQDGIGQSFDETLNFRCAGTVKIAKERRGKISWRERPYQFNGTVHLSVRDGVVLDETHNFVRTGYLLNNGRPRFVGLSIDSQFTLYESETYFLKVHVDDNSVWFMQKFNMPLGTNGSRELWQRLSNVNVEAKNSLKD